MCGLARSLILRLEAWLAPFFALLQMLSDLRPPGVPEVDWLVIMQNIKLAQILHTKSISDFGVCSKWKISLPKVWHSFKDFIHSSPKHIGVQITLMNWSIASYHSVCFGQTSYRSKKRARQLPESIEATTKKMPDDLPGPLALSLLLPVTLRLFLWGPPEPGLSQAPTTSQMRRISQVWTCH